MKFYRLALFVVVSVSLSCSVGDERQEFDPNKNYSGEELATIYCGSCHRYPEPALLSKEIWEHRVLPLMGQKLGIIDFNLAMSGGYESLPAPSVSDSNWQKIKLFYLENAVPAPEKDTRTYSAADLFEVRSPEYNFYPFTTSIKFNPAERELYVSSNQTFYTFSADLEVKDSVKVPSPVTATRLNQNQPEILSVGNIHPNDLKQGILLAWNSVQGRFLPEIDSLRRPVDFISVDLNKDGTEEKVVCEFGNNEGEVSVFLPEENRKIVISSSPGARKVVAHDFDENGYADLMVQFGQGDERISIFYNNNLSFREEVVLRFPPVYGSSYFDTLDFNQDGKLDVYAVFGDNADYSIMLKEFHGLRVFKNSGDNSFKETAFVPVFGATEARADDFDLDGDIDFSVIAHFADYVNAPQNSFVFIENEEGELKPKVLEAAPEGRWLTMEKADYDQDGDTDLFLGSFVLPSFGPARGKESYKIPFVLLENKTVKKQERKPAL